MKTLLGNLYDIGSCDDKWHYPKRRTIATSELDVKQSDHLFSTDTEKTSEDPLPLQPELLKRPILVVCYTNHALDQFLEGILEYCSGNGRKACLLLLLHK